MIFSHSLLAGLPASDEGQVISPRSQTESLTQIRIEDSAYWRTLFRETKIVIIQRHNLAQNFFFFFFAPA